MKKNYLWPAVMVVLLLAGCSREEDAMVPETQKTGQSLEMIPDTPLTPLEINAAIDQKLQSTGGFTWKEGSAHLAWSAILNGRNLVSVGFGRNVEDFDRAKLPNAASIEQDLINRILQLEGQPYDKVVVNKDPFLTTMDLVITKPETLLMLRRDASVRYAEPADYHYFEVARSVQRVSSSDGSGCGFDASTLSAADYTTVTPNAKVAWTLYQHNVPNAWALSTGQGVTIGIVDTGVSPNQTLLGSSFNDGLSSGRTIQKYGVYVDSIWPWATGTDGPNDQCGHGTSMASAAAGPRNDNGLPVGVAYNANLVTYRAASNVVLDGVQEQNGVKAAFTALGNNANVKIISMSMGHIFTVSKISDGVKYAYSKGKLIFCAGGTSTSFTTFVGVIFPASMAEAVAVTGIKEGSTFVKCDDCHSGSKIDFTVVMQRAATGNTVPVESYYDNQSDYVGGSSVATATTAGIAALVWARYPSWTRDQVLARLRQSGNFYPTKNPEFGYGNINALTAVQ